MSSGQDVRFSEDKVAQGQQLTNKLWNASRLILLGVGPEARAVVSPTTIEDRWILSRLERAVAEVDRRVEQFDFSHAALALYDFIYGELCDWYLELVKPRLRAGEPELAATLLHVLTRTLAMAHPLIPFVSEEIYAHVPGATGLLAAGIASAETPRVDEHAEASIERVIGAVQALRGWRDSVGVKAGVTVAARLAAEGYEQTSEHLERMARIALSQNGGDPVATVPVPGGAIEILASEGLDLEGTNRRRAAQRAKLEAEIDRSRRKLENEGFAAKAPAHIVEAERAKLAGLEAELEALRAE
jgi:valyl-tRNA synthetase